MEKDELKELLKIDFPDAKGDFNKTYKAYETQKRFSRLKLNKIAKLVIYTIIICAISVSSTLLIYKNVAGKNSKVPPRNEGVERNPYEALPFYIFKDMPSFDTFVAFGPEVGSVTFSIDVILSANLLKEEDENELLNYAEIAKKNAPDHKVGFQIYYGIIDEKDYIYLIDQYYVRKKGHIFNTFLFESNLPYSFSSLLDDFENLTGVKLDKTTLESPYFNHQNTMDCGIVLSFIEINNTSYKEYYIIKSFDRRVFVLNK